MSSRLFRVRGIPVSLSKAEVRTHLLYHLNIGTGIDGEYGDDILDILSLAHSPGDTSENTAVFRFTRDIQERANERLDEKIIQCSCPGRSSVMVIDTEFSGLTSIHSPAEYDMDWEIDIIALPGLSGHAMGSFKQRGENFLWLRDEVPKHIPTARVFTYGYDTVIINSTSTTNIHHLGSGLAAALECIRSGMFLAPGKPLVLIGHSIGGIVIKEAIMQMLRRSESELSAIVNSIAGIFFFDTPHKGMNIQSFKPMVEGAPNGEFMYSLSRRSELLTQHAETFEQVFAVNDCEIICFYATRESPTPEISDGRWRMAGPRIMIVDYDSTMACKPQKNVSFQAFPIESDHSNIIKFKPQDFVYVTKVLPKLQKYRKRGEAKSEFGPDTVFRLRGIPPDCSIDELPLLIRECLSISEAAKTTIGSLATDPTDDTELIATLSFSRVPIKLSKKYSRHGSGDEWHFPGFTVGRFSNVHLALDKHFRGLTPLHTCQDHECATDLIALSGLNGHAFGSFKVKGDPFMWLRDSLPTKLPKTRILIYGYDTQLVKSRSFQTLQDLGVSLRATLHMIQTLKPTILLGHSLGGLVTKQAMVAMNQEATSLDTRILGSIRGILFFGTPHLGMDIRSLIPIVGDNPNIVLLNTLRAGSTELTALGTEFERALMHGSATIMSFHETVESPTATMTEVEKDGRITEVWSMSGPPATLVSVQSATHGTGDARPINRNHSDLVKFDGPYDHVYRHILDVLRRMARGDVQTTVRKAAVVQPKSSWRAFLEALRT